MQNSPVLKKSNLVEHLVFNERQQQSYCFNSCWEMQGLIFSTIFFELQVYCFSLTLQLHIFTCYFLMLQNILVSNWQGYLNTIKTDAQGRYPFHISLRILLLLLSLSFNSIGYVLDFVLVFGFYLSMPSALWNRWKSQNVRRKQGSFSGNSWC